MNYNEDRFLADHPVFRREELGRALATDPVLAPGKAEGLLQKTLSALIKKGRTQKIRNGLYATRTVMQEMPEWLPYAVASRVATDAVIGFQAALWLHLGNSPPPQLRVYTSTLEDDVHFPDETTSPKWTIIPMQSGRGPTRGQNPLSVAGIIEYQGLFQDCPLSLRATTPERTLIDILDGAHGRPRNSASGEEIVEESGNAECVENPQEGPAIWPSQSFKECWEALRDTDRDLCFNDICEHLSNHPRKRPLTAKVGFFLSLHRERFGLTQRDLLRLSDLPDSPHRWAQCADDSLDSRWRIYVPKGLLPDGHAATKDDEEKTTPRLKSGIQVPGTDLRLELERRFGNYGIRKFRDCQEEIIRAVLEGRDAIAILPTGAGKSLTYQFPSTLMEGPTLVISPLISLIADQVREAREMGLTAYSFQGNSNFREYAEATIAMEEGILNLLFVSPESWVTMLETWPQLQNSISQLVVDEAHLINSWGQDFRFDYQKLGGLRERFPEVPLLALTATATREARQRITEKLNFRAGAEIRKMPVKRPHLYLSRRPTSGDFCSKYQALLGFIEPRKTSPGIVYCQSRRDAISLAEKLKADLFGKEKRNWLLIKKRRMPHPARSNRNSEILRIAATTLSKRTKRVQAYHAGMLREDREIIQQDFLDGRCSLMVATVAFGMGVNKKNIRFVAHFGPPPSLDNYVQEVGRGGRDAFWAECLILHSEADWVIWRKRLEKTERKIMADNSTKGRKKQESRLNRVSDRREDLKVMEHFVKGEHCLHRKIEERFFDSKFDKKEPEDCGRACDECFLPDDHRSIMLREMANLEQGLLL